MALLFQSRQRRKLASEEINETIGFQLVSKPCTYKDFIKSLTKSKTREAVPTQLIYNIEVPLYRKDVAELTSVDCFKYSEFLSHAYLFHTESSTLIDVYGSKLRNVPKSLPDTWSIDTKLLVKNRTELKKLVTSLCAENNSSDSDSDFGDFDYESDSSNDNLVEDLATLSIKESIWVQYQHSITQLGHNLQEGIIELIETSETISAEDFFVKLLCYKRVPTMFQHQQIKVSDIPTIIEEHVIKSQRNPFLVPLYKILKFDARIMQKMPIQTSTSFDLIKNITDYFGPMNWLWEFVEVDAEGNKAPDRLDVVLVDANVVFECDEKGHVQYNNAVEIERDQRIKYRGYTVIHYNPDNENISDLVFCLVPRIRVQLLVTCLCKGNLNDQMLLKYCIPQEDQSRVEQYEHFINAFGAALQSELGMHETLRSKYPFSETSVCTFLNFESVQCLREQLLENDFNENTDWALDSAGNIVISAEVFNCLLLQSRGSLAMCARKIYWQMKEILKDVLYEYRQLQKMFVDTRRKYSQTLMVNRKLKQRLNKLENQYMKIKNEHETANYALRAYNKEYGVLKQEETISHNLQYCFRTTENVSSVALSAFWENYRSRYCVFKTKKSLKSWLLEHNYLHNNRVQGIELV